MPEALITLEDIAKRYQLGALTVDALRGVSCTIHAGEYVAITGPSGSGKSTLMQIMGCLDRPSRGRYTLVDREVSRLDDEELAEVRNRRIGFVFQSFNLLPRLSALDNVALPLVYAGLSRGKRRARARQALELVRLGERTGHRPNELSGGERQRVAIARAIVNRPSLVLADEPTGNLDQKVGVEIVELFERLNREEQVTLVVITHDRELAARAPRRIDLRDGEILSDGAT